MLSLFLFSDPLHDISGLAHIRFRPIVILAVMVSNILQRDVLDVPHVQDVVPCWIVDLLDGTDDFFLDADQPVYQGIDLCLDIYQPIHGIGHPGLGAGCADPAPFHA